MCNLSIYIQKPYSSIYKTKVKSIHMMMMMMMCFDIGLEARKASNSAGF